jgi:hypothetical protein
MREWSKATREHQYEVLHGDPAFGMFIWQPTLHAKQIEFRQKIWGHPLAASGQLAKRIPDASHHLIPMVAT